MTVDQLLQQFERFGVRLGLESSYALLNNLGNPQRQVSIIHVAGSNGKGSVCAYLSAILTEAGYRVGRFISPHLISWTERICINDQPITAPTLEAVLKQVIAAIDPAEPPTQFEVITAAAWLHFAQAQVDLAVMEVGLGGRLDATNVCDHPLVSVITSISREHWQRLGPTLADIAWEKAGILKPNCPTVIGTLPPEAASVIHRRAAALGCTAIYPPAAKDLGNGLAEYHSFEEIEVTIDSDGMQAEADMEVELTLQYRLPLQGAIQLQNSALAIASVQLLRQYDWPVETEAIVCGIEKTRWPGRLQWFTWQGQQILIDGAHNPASAKVLRQFVDSLAHPGPTHWVMGMLSTKDHSDIFAALLRSGDALYLVPVPGHDGADPAALAELAQHSCPGLAVCKPYPDVLTALQAAASLQPAETETRPIEPLMVLSGSLYLIGHFLQLVNQTSDQSDSQR